MAPGSRKARDGVANAAGASSGRRKQAEPGPDDELLDQAGTGNWMDSIVILGAVRYMVSRILALSSQATSGTAKDARKKEKGPSQSVKEDTAQWIANDFKIPVGLLTIFVLTCALIAGGEGFHERNQEKREVVDDYYGTLGVPRDAETADVKRAYKTLAKLWHPDRNPNCSSCQETFSKIAVAYETLSDEKKRSAYDESGEIATAELKSARSVPLTRDNFDELVTFSNDVWIVQIFKPDDGGCAQFHPFWENQIQKHGHLVRFGRVDVTNDPGKWLPVKVRVLPMILKYARHLGVPEIFPITAMHETPQHLMKFVLTSFPNIGLPLHKDPSCLSTWLRSSTRRHKVLFAIPGKSEEERYKSHLVPRKLATTWSEIFEFRTVELAALHKLPDMPAEVLSALPPQNQSETHGAMLFFSASSNPRPKSSAVFAWPTGEEELVLQLIGLAELAAPALSANSAELLCRSLAIRRVYCLVLLDPTDSTVSRAAQELKESRAQYTREVADIRASGGEVTEDEDNFIVPAVRLFKQPRGLQPSISTCHAPLFSQVEKSLGGASAFLMDLDTGRMAALRGLTSFRGIFPQIAYEDSLVWVEDTLHPFLSLPDCNEGMLQHFRRSLREAPFWGVAMQLFTIIFLLEAVGRAAVDRSPRWAAGAALLLSLMLLRSPPFLRRVAAYLPGAWFAPPLLSS